MARQSKPARNVTLSPPRSVSLPARVHRPDYKTPPFDSFISITKPKRTHPPTKLSYKTTLNTTLFFCPLLDAPLSAAAHDPRPGPRGATNHTPKHPRLLSPPTTNLLPEANMIGKCLAACCGFWAAICCCGCLEPAVFY